MAIGLLSCLVFQMFPFCVPPNSVFARRLAQWGIPSFVLSMIIISSVRRSLHDFVPIGTIYNHFLFFPFSFASSFSSNTNKFVGKTRDPCNYSQTTQTSYVRTFSTPTKNHSPQSFVIVELGISQTGNFGLSWRSAITLFFRCWSK